ncbi:MAG: hypothetical protein IJT94_06735 [Oscillibacter sp.]|nr:hypothetical protein [Oscillibacter sp.]
MEIPGITVEHMSDEQRKTVVDALVDLILRKAKIATNAADVQALAALTQALDQFCRC